MREAQCATGWVAVSAPDSARKEGLSPHPDRFAIDPPLQGRVKITPAD